MQTFTKIATKMLFSSVWELDDKTLRVWLTLLLLKGPDSIVLSTLAALARTAKVPVADCDKALKILSAPDADSASKKKEGRRIVPIDGGWEIVNGDMYRHWGADEENRVQTRERMARLRAQGHTARPATSPPPSDDDAPVGPSDAAIASWLADARKNGADYTDQEVRLAAANFRANGWVTYNNQRIVDFRAALERQIWFDRRLLTPKAGAAQYGGSRDDLVAEIRDLEMRTMPDTSTGKQVWTQKQIAQKEELTTLKAKYQAMTGTPWSRA